MSAIVLRLSHTAWPSGAPEPMRFGPSLTLAPRWIIFLCSDTTFFGLMRTGRLFLRSQSAGTVIESQTSEGSSSSSCPACALAVGKSLSPVPDSAVTTARVTWGVAGRLAPDRGGRLAHARQRSTHTAAPLLTAPGPHCLRPAGALPPFGSVQ